MSVILESDILDAYAYGDINEYDIVNFYTEGYISDNTIDMLVDEDDYISEAAIEVYNEELDSLEEGMIKRGFNNVRAALTRDKAKKISLMAANAKDARRDGKQITSANYMNKARAIKFGSLSAANADRNSRIQKNMNTLAQQRDKWKGSAKTLFGKLKQEKSAHADTKSSMGQQLANQEAQTKRWKENSKSVLRKLKQESKNKEAAHKYIDDLHYQSSIGGHVPHGQYGN